MLHLADVLVGDTPSAHVGLAFGDCPIVLIQTDET
jgi:hypothetical protein